MAPSTGLKPPRRLARRDSLGKGLHDVETSPGSGFFGRHEFLIRRLHSLSGLIPVGAYMVIHLLTNASVLDGTKTFQARVDQIHSLGGALPFIEWTFIFLPLLFHAVIGVAIIRGGSSNVGQYSYGANWRYTLQRITAWIAMIFIFAHVFHLHGWVKPLAAQAGGAQFDPHHATSSAAGALQASLLIEVAYAIGVLACVYHLANGLWTMGITWGVWTSPAAQRRANWACAAFGVGLAAVGLGALGGFSRVDVDEAKQVEARLEVGKKVTAGEALTAEEAALIEHTAPSAESTPEAGGEQEKTPEDQAAAETSGTDLSLSR